MRRDSVKPASRGGEGDERAIERWRGNLHQIGHLGPDEGGPDGPVRIDAAKHRAIKRKLRHVAGRHILGSPRRGTVRLVVPDQHALRRDGEAIHLAGDQVDRLAITAQGVLIGDYKTNRPPPRRTEDVPPGYVTQLALYRAVLGCIYPDRPIRAALIWTEVPDLMEISAPTLD